jgi:hypothetical protein
MLRSVYQKESHIYIDIVGKYSFFINDDDLEVLITATSTAASSTAAI